MILAKPTRPLHVGYANDNSGRKILVKFRGGDLSILTLSSHTDVTWQYDQGETMSLYDVWDHAISEVRKVWKFGNRSRHQS